MTALRRVVDARTEPVTVTTIGQPMPAASSALELWSPNIAAVAVRPSRRPLEVTARPLDHATCEHRVADLARSVRPWMGVLAGVFAASVALGFTGLGAEMWIAIVTGTGVFTVIAVLVQLLAGSGRVHCPGCPR